MLMSKELRTIAGSITGGGFFAGTATTVGSLGSTILSGMGYAGYVVSESAKMGSISTGINFSMFATVWISPIIQSLHYRTFVKNYHTMHPRH